MDGKEKLAKLCLPREETIPAYSILNGYGYLRHRGCGLQSSRSPGYRTYLTILSYELDVVLAFACRASFSVVKKLGTGSGKEDGT